MIMIIYYEYDFSYYYSLHTYLCMLHCHPLQGCFVLEALVRMYVVVEIHHSMMHLLWVSFFHLMRYSVIVPDRNLFSWMVRIPSGSKMFFPSLSSIGS
jgi:hypothetical protein